MNSKDTILEALRANSPAPLERGPLGFTPMTFEDPLAEFRERVVKAAAARCFLLEEGRARCFLLEEGRSAAEAVAAIVRRTYPDARRIASNLPEAAACATFNPDELEDPRSLAGTDVAIVRGAFGVAENGAVWIPRTFRHKALLFIPEALVILLDRTQIVCTMHEAYSGPRHRRPRSPRCLRHPPVASAPPIPTFCGHFPLRSYHNGSISRDSLPLRNCIFLATPATVLLSGIPLPSPLPQRQQNPRFPAVVESPLLSLFLIRQGKTPAHLRL